MADFQVQASRSFGAPAAAVFAMLNDNERFFDLRPGAVDHRDIELLPTGGHNCTQEFEIRGRRLKQKSRSVEFVPPVLMVDVAEGDGHTTAQRIEIEEHGDRSHLTILLHTAYTAPIGRFRCQIARRNASRSLKRFIDRLDGLLGAT